jgi:hypothetical protein
MTEEPESLVLRLLGRMDEKVDRVIEGQSDIGRRMTSLEERVGRMQAELASIHGDFAGQSLRMDRFDQRRERIERRLDLTETA